MIQKNTAKATFRQNAAKSESAKIPVNMAGACGELRRAPARPSGKTREPQPAQLHAPWPTPGGGETTGRQKRLHRVGPRLGREEQGREAVLGDNGDTVL